MKIVLDCMSGDLGAKPAVEGAAAAVKKFGVEVVLVGKSDEIEAVIRDSALSHDGLTVVEAADLITMEDDPVRAVREHPDSSMIVALKTLASGEGDAIVSAGNTGALLTGATLIVKRMQGIRRGALCALLPTKSGHALLMDCGANVECTSEMLVQFACMGSAFVSGTMGIASPRVGLINNGTESHKGTPLCVETYGLLTKLAENGSLNFIGNIEGRDIAGGGADVFVTDGFTGNIVLKTYEGIGLFFADKLKKLFGKNLFTKIAALPLLSGIKELKGSMDYKEVGGAPILGLRKPVFKAHGSCDARAFASAIAQAVRYCDSGAASAMEASLAALNSLKNE